MCTRRTRRLLLALLGASSLAGASPAMATFRGINGTLALERQDYSDSGVQFDTAYHSDAALLLGAAGEKPQALLSCTGGGSSDTACKAGAGCPDRASDPNLCLDLGRPAFSADGRTIAFADDMCKTAFCRRLALVATDGPAETILAPLTADDSQPAFLPTGALVFSGRPTLDAVQNLYTVNADGTGLQPLTGNGGSEAAPCDDGSIAFVRRGNLYLFSADRRSIRRLTFRGGTRPDCSPDGRWIAFQRRSDVYLISRTGKQLRRVTADGRVQGAPSFSPDGRLLAFDAQHDPSRRWPPHKTRGDFNHYYSNAYLQVVDLQGDEVRAPILLGNTGADQDGFGYGTAVGGVGWQALPAGGASSSRAIGR